MPIYEYHCSACHFQKEFLQKLSDPTLSTCPECGQATFNKMVTAAGFQLKGSGWYATDFKGTPKKTDSPEKTETTESAPAATEGGHACGTGACPACT